MSRVTLEALVGYVEEDLESVIASVLEYRSDAREHILDLYDDFVCALERKPEMFSAKYKDIRRGYLKKTFYAVYYQYNGNQVLILAVLDGRRNPLEISKLVNVRRRVGRLKPRSR